VHADGTVDGLAINRVLSEYCHRVDAGDFDGVAMLFTADGSFALGAHVASGPPAVSDWLRQMQPPERRGTHMTANVLVDVDGDCAVARSTFTFVRWIDGALVIETAGRYHDDLRREGGQWRFAHRRCELLRRHDAGAQPH
jgi:ketosteroid isomerase-like protein